MSGKEHRIPIRVSKVLRILEGTRDDSEHHSKKVYKEKTPLSFEHHEKHKKAVAAHRERHHKHVATKTTQPQVQPKADGARVVPIIQLGKIKHQRHGELRPHSATLPATEEIPLQKDEGKETAPIVSVVHETKVVPDQPVVEVPESPVMQEKKPAFLSVDGIDFSTMRVGYFCMEMGVHQDLPFYAGGLGILAGDMLKSCADLSVPVVGVTLLYRKGFFKQRFDESGWQMEEQDVVEPEKLLRPLDTKVRIVIEGRTVVVRGWMYTLQGMTGHRNPIIFLDTDTPENSANDRGITHSLYSGDHTYRIKQEAVLGIAGFRFLEALGVTEIEKYHMNEGHSSLLTIELYKRYQKLVDPLRLVHEHAVFTTHTPIAAGHDRFSRDEVEGVLGKAYLPKEIESKIYQGNVLNMTRLGFEFSGHINGVAKRHKEVTREMFPGYHVESVTNGVYARDWVSEPFRMIFEKYLPTWESDPYTLRYAMSIPQVELWETHMIAKRKLLSYVAEVTGVKMDEHAFTMGFARRATEYKRPELLWGDVQRLIQIAKKYPQGMQIIYSGKAHPHDHAGKLMIQRLKKIMQEQKANIKAVYLPNYDIAMAKLLVSGVDLWLNTPTRPQEASGTSGMKAALNGVSQLSVLDGWWIEGHIEHVTGWSIGPHPEERKDVLHEEDREDLYTKLEYVVLPKFYEDRDAWVRMMRQAIAINGSFFNTHRMVSQYVTSAYFL